MTKLSASDIKLIRSNPSAKGRKEDRGLGMYEKAVTIVTFADGKTASCWGHQKGRNVAGLKCRNMSARSGIERVDYVVRDDMGRGAIVRTIASFKLVALDLIAI